MRFSFNNFLRHWWPVVGLLVVEGILFAFNYKPGTFLMGWDNVMPELNFKVNVVRSLVGVWQEHRGLGLYDGMSHITNLPHTIFLWILSFIFPINLLRYVFTFSMHALGGIGMFLLTKQLLGNNRRTKGLMIPFIASLFYLLNIATIQMFYTPLEAFSVHFAALPWLGLTVINYLTSGSKASLIAFFLVSLVSTPQYFVPTLLLPVALLLFIISATTLLADATTWRHVFTAGAGFLLVNAFWLAPYLYGLPGNAPVIAGAKINQMSSNEAFVRNQAFGDLKNVLLMWGFSLDFQDVAPDGTITYLMQPWRNHLNTRMGTIRSWMLAGMMLTGVGLSMGKKNRQFLPFGLLFLVAFVFLGNDIPILRIVVSFLRDHIPFFGEAFRFPFTKFSLLFAFSGSVLLGLMLDTLNKRVKYFFVIFCTIFIFYIALPAFQGNFIYKNLRITMPNEYLALFAFMQKQDTNGRVALLPQSSYWSWKYYRFGYRGSGFLWYGLPQPTMDRAFDPWSAQNENYYWELTRALYNKDEGAIDNIFAKYAIRYILLDENIVSTSNDRSLFIDETKELLTSMPTIKSLASIGKLTVYERPAGTKSFVAIKENLPTVSPIYRRTDNDVAFADFGDYIATTDGQLTYPFRSLFTKLSLDEREFTVNALEPKDLVFDTASQPSLLASSVTRCGLLRPGTIHAENQQNGVMSWLRLSAANQRACLSFGVPGISHKDGYLVTVESRHLSGQPLLFSLISDTTKHTETETYLPTKPDWQTSSFILPPLAPDGLGYTVYISNDHISGKESINDIRRVQVSTIPYNDLVHMHSGNIPSNKSSTYGSTVWHPNPALYQVKFDKQPPTSTTIMLDQSFDPGWVAWDGKQLLPHVLVNNWANAWLVEPKSADQAQHEPSTNSSEKANAKLRRRWNGDTIYIFFLPQLLEWIGFLLLPLPFFFSLKIRR